jgi:predicted protein tyrosine phosphatase
MLIICGLQEANEILAKPNHGIRAAISILDPGMRDLYDHPMLKTVERVLRIEFDDVESEFEDYQHPTQVDAQTILDFVRANINEPMLIHCWQGISRSTAVGLLVCALCYGVGCAREELLKIRPKACPNTLLCDHLGYLAGLGKELFEIAMSFDYQELKKLARESG